MSKSKIAFKKMFFVLRDYLNRRAIKQTPKEIIDNVDALLTTMKVLNMDDVKKGIDEGKYDTSYPPNRNPGT